MAKTIKKVLLILLAFGISLFITRLSGIIPVGTQPQIQEAVIACGRNGPESSVPTHTYGLPIPYITSYWGNPSCGFNPATSKSQFMMDAVIWFVAVTGMFVILKHFSQATLDSAHRKP